MSKSAHALVFCGLISYTISLVSLGEAILFFYFYALHAFSDQPSRNVFILKSYSNWTF